MLLIVASRLLVHIHPNCICFFASSDRGKWCLHIIAPREPAKLAFFKNRYSTGGCKNKTELMSAELVKIIGKFSYQCVHCIWATHSFTGLLGYLDSWLDSWLVSCLCSCQCSCHVAASVAASVAVSVAASVAMQTGGCVDGLLASIQASWQQNWTAVEKAAS